ncbi:MAG TPA: hypothetical protein VGR35_02475 [Tepidisphaeraceae bacterium]|nr:hypothetical protein [Tepidisphaeraceae bacterium]
MFRSRVEGYCAVTYGAILDDILADLAVAEAQEGYKYVGWHFYEASTRDWREVILVCNMTTRRLERIERPEGGIVDDVTHQNLMSQMPYVIDVPGYKGRFDADVDECIRAVLPERKPATSESNWLEPQF